MSVVFGPIAGAAEGFVEIVDGFNTGTDDDSSAAAAEAFNKCLGDYVDDVVNQAMGQTCTNAINTQNILYMEAAKKLFSTVNKKDYDFMEERDVIVSLDCSSVRFPDIVRIILVLSSLASFLLMRA